MIKIVVTDDIFSIIPPESDSTVYEVNGLSFVGEPVMFDDVK